MENRIRLLILQSVDAASPFAIPESTLIKSIIHVERPKPTEATVKKEIRFLLDKSLIHQLKDEVLGTSKYSITEAGNVYLNQ